MHMTLRSAQRLLGSAATNRRTRARTPQPEITPSPGSPSSTNPNTALGLVITIMVVAPMTPASACAARPTPSCATPDLRSLVVSQSPHTQFARYARNRERLRHSLSEARTVAAEIGDNASPMVITRYNRDALARGPPAPATTAIMTLNSFDMANPSGLNRSRLMLRTATGTNHWW